MSPSTTLVACKAAGVALAAAGLFVIAREYARRGAPPLREPLARYLAFLERQIRICFLPTTPIAIARGQALAIAGGVALFLALGDPRAWLAVVGAALLPPLWLVVERRKRVGQLDAQADGFALALANALKAVPNVGAALHAVFPVLRDPVRQEVATVLKEMRVGTPVDQALLNASARAKSPALDSALSAVLIGRQVGGNLPRVLETTAHTLREMNRLEGVVKTKTAEGRAQLWVLALFPLGICAAFNAVSPGYFDPLQQSLVGHLLSALAVFLWLGALLLARKVMEVDL